MSVNLTAIPDSLKQYPNWVAWRYEERDGNKTKVLYSKGRRAKTNDPKTWLTFDQAVTEYSDNQTQYAGIGFVITPPMFGVDMDSCIKPDGSLTDWATNVLEHCPSYCEVSPSGVGLKIIAVGDLPMPMHHTDGKLKCGRNFAGDKYNLESACEGKKSEILIYRQKFFTITGNVLDGYSEVTNCPGVAELFTSLVESIPSHTATQTTAARSDESADRVKAAIFAMNKIPVSPTENDGSNRLMAYGRQAKRFIVNEHDALRAIRSMLLNYPTPKAWSDDEILKRYNEADVEAGSAYEPRDCGGVDLRGIDAQSIGKATGLPAAQTSIDSSPQAETKSEPQPATEPPKPPEPATSPAEGMLAAWLGRVNRGELPQLIKQTGALKGIEIGPGMITIIGAPPGAGKTALVMQVMFDAIELDESLRGIVANAETTFDGLIRREITRKTWLPKIGCVDSDRLRFGPLTIHELERVNAAASDLGKRLERVAVLNEPCNVVQLARLRDEAPGLLIVDYIQKFAPGDKDARTGVNEVMAVLRMLAKCGWAVVGLSATKRDPNGKHSPKELSLSSFRESGEIEYNADSAYVLQDNGPLERSYLRHVTLGHVKNRHGPMVNKELRFDMPRMQFTALIEPEPQGYEEFGQVVELDDDPFDSEAA